MSFSIVFVRNNVTLDGHYRHVDERRGSGFVNAERGVQCVRLSKYPLLVYRLKPSIDAITGHQQSMCRGIHMFKTFFLPHRKKHNVSSLNPCSLKIY